MTTGKDEIISALQANLMKLKGLYENEKAKNKQLLNEKSELSDKVLLQQKQIESLEVKMNTLKLAKSISGTNNDMHDAKLKVTHLVREIDKCIALLNR